MAGSSDPAGAAAPTPAQVWARCGAVEAPGSSGPWSPPGGAQSSFPAPAGPQAAASPPGPAAAPPPGRAPSAAAPAGSGASGPPPAAECCPPPSKAPLPADRAPAKDASGRRSAAGSLRSAAAPPFFPPAEPAAPWVAPAAALSDAGQCAHREFHRRGRPLPGPAAAPLLHKGRGKAASPSGRCPPGRCPPPSGPKWAPAYRAPLQTAPADWHFHS